MSEIVERLPWRLGALAGLLVGAVSLFGGTDPWICLVRVAAAFLLFGLLGLGLRSLFRHGLASASPSNKDPDSKDGTSDASGTHVDQTTPEMTVEDLQSGEPKAYNQTGDGTR